MKARLCLAPDSGMNRLKNRSGGGELPHCLALAATLAVGLFTAQLARLAAELGRCSGAASARQTVQALCGGSVFLFHHST